MRAGGKIVVLDGEARHTAAVRAGLDALGVPVVACAEWRAAARACAAGTVAAVVVDADHAGDRLAEWCQAWRKDDARRRRGGGGGDAAEAGRERELPILALSESRRMADTEALFSLGVTDCLAKPVDAKRLAWKLKRWIVSVRRQQSGADDALETPPALREIFERVAEAGGHLGDAVEVHGGVTVRHPTFRRMAPPTGEWLGLSTGDAVRPFGLGKPTSFVKFAPEALFRMPADREYKPEKVVVRRVGPPVTAALDASGLPIAADLMAAIPRAGSGLNAGFVACLLNSRLADFWFNRLWERGVRQGAATLMGTDLGALPLAWPDPNDLAYFHRAAKLLTHYGPRPANAHDRERRTTLWAEANARLFDLYGVDRDALDTLEKLHF